MSGRASQLAKPHPSFSVLSLPLQSNSVRVSPMPNTYNNRRGLHGQDGQLHISSLVPLLLRKSGYSRRIWHQRSIRSTLTDPSRESHLRSTEKGSVVLSLSFSLKPNRRAVFLAISTYSEEVVYHETFDFARVDIARSRFNITRYVSAYSHISSYGVATATRTGAAAEKPCP